jgi:hypothetical protein
MMMVDMLALTADGSLTVVTFSPGFNLRMIFTKITHSLNARHVVLFFYSEPIRSIKKFRKTDDLIHSKLSGVFGSAEKIHSGC